MEGSRKRDFQEKKHLCRCVCVCVHIGTHRGPREGAVEGREAGERRVAVGEAAGPRTRHGQKSSLGRDKRQFSFQIWTLGGKDMDKGLGGHPPAPRCCSMGVDDGRVQGLHSVCIT